MHAVVRRTNDVLFPLFTVQAEAISIDPGSRCGTEPEIEFMFSINGTLYGIEQEKEEGVRTRSRAIQQYNAEWGCA